MNHEEMESLVKQLKAAGLSEEQIMETFFETFQDGKMDREDLEALAEFMGYELTDDFKKDETPDPIASGEGIDETKAEDLKEIQPGESKEEFIEKVEEAKGDEEPEKAEEEKSESIEEEKADDGEEEEIDEDKEWEEVQKKFHW